MDPDATLTKLREAILELRDSRDLDPVDRRAANLADDAFTDLDAWLNKGGFLPTDWNALHRCGSPTEASLEPHVRKGTLGDTMAALQRVGDAVRLDDRISYLEAVTAAYQLGCSIEQVDDAYRFAASTTAGRVRFDISGKTTPF